MDFPSERNAKGYWAAAAKRLAWRRNFASWLDLYLPVLLVVSGLASVTLVVFRLLDKDARFLWISWGGALLLGAVIVAMIAARKLFIFDEALACLDETGHLHNRLVSAQAGVGPWPEPRGGVRDATRWNWSRVLYSVISAGLLLAASSLVKPAHFRTRTAAAVEPAARSQVASWLKTLDQAQVADPQALQKLQEQLDDLRHSPSEDWYEQDQLEAGEAMRQQMEQGLHDMQNALQKSSDVMAVAVQKDGQLSPSELKTLSSSLQQALQGLQTGSLPANKDLLEKMKDFNPANLHQMTPQQFAELQQRMSQGLKTCNQCVSPKLVPGKNGQDGKGTPGGLGGGGKTAPLNLSNEATDLQSKRLETSNGDDMSRAVPGDVLAVTKGSHTVDKNAPAQPLAGGAISSAGNGGDAVWRDSLTPGEHQVLQRYFK